MAFTYSSQDAIDFVVKYVKDIPVTSIDAIVCDTVSSIMYTDYFWRWTVQNIPAGSIPLVDGTQDYSVPTNLYRMWRARIVRTDTTPDQYNEIDVKQSLTPDLTKAGPFQIPALSHDESAGSLRLTSAVQISSGETYEIQGDYQINPTKITDATLGSGLWFPDQYFPVFCEGLKWKLYEYTDDSRAGTVQIDRAGNRTATGQAGKFYMALDQMKQAEDYGSGSESEFPDSPLGEGSYGGYSIVYGGQ